MLKDAKTTAPKYIEFFLNNIQQEENDGLFEKQFDLANSAINTFTPRAGRDELNERVFDVIKSLIINTNKEQANRIVILKSKLVLFAHTNKTKKFLLDWKANKIEELKEHPQTIGQQWSTVVKAFTLPDLSLEEK